MSWRSELLDEATSDERSRLFRFWSAQWLSTWPRFRRASHLCVCETCDKLYIQHPLFNDGVLNRLCNGDLVKL